MAVDLTKPAVDETLAALRDDAGSSALFFDIDGTLAPVVLRAHEAHVPDAVSKLLGVLAREYALVACVSGRTAGEARRLVGVGPVTYVGSHGAELLRGGGGAPMILPELEAWQDRVVEFAQRHDDFALRRLQVRIEDKGFIQAFHWRGVPDTEAAHAAVERIAADAEEAGLAVHWARKVLEVRPPVPFNKGLAVRKLVLDAGVRGALYAGDDATDADAFAVLRDLRDVGKIDHAVCIGVLSEECPDEVRAGADFTVAGTEQMLGVLTALAG